MAKKKTSAVAYTPYGDVSQIPQIVEKKVEQIPPYEDSGIAYKGKYKVQTGSNSYELKGQQTRWYAMAATALGKTVFTRENKDTTVFYCTKVVIQNNCSSSGSTTYDTLSDRYNGQDAIKVVNWTNTANQTYVLDLSDCPRQFFGDFVIDKCSSGGAEFSAFILYGWEEQK